MKKICVPQGFTLIELLVVVLIIGILATVAVPQYKAAVEKARFTEAITITKNVKDAQERYYLAHGTYTTNIEDLDISFPFSISDNGDTVKFPSGITLHIANLAYLYATNKTFTNTIVLYYDHIDSANAKIKLCHAKQTNSTANTVCKSLGGKNPRNSSGCSIGACTVYDL